jgi:predicted anti-sigma-YlaC factor YlaD
MKEQAGKINPTCPRMEIAAYVDGELAPRQELALEQHLAACETCRAELNEQKKLLCALDFMHEANSSDIEIPKNFARVVATRAESNVSGLRNREERGRAIFLCASLFFLVVVGLGAETEKVFTASTAILERVLAVLTFFGHLTFDVAFGVVVILRSLANQSVIGAALVVAFAAGFWAVFWFALSRIRQSSVSHVKK